MFLLYDIAKCDIHLTDREHECSHKHRCRIPRKSRDEKSKDGDETSSRESISSCSDDEDDSASCSDDYNLGKSE